MRFALRIFRVHSHSVAKMPFNVVYQSGVCPLCRYRYKQIGINIVNRWYIDTQYFYIHSEYACCSDHFAHIATDSAVAIPDFHPLGRILPAVDDAGANAPQDAEPSPAAHASADASASTDADPRCPHLCRERIGKLISCVNSQHLHDKDGTLKLHFESGRFR